MEIGTIENTLDRIALYDRVYDKVVSEKNTEMKAQEDYIKKTEIQMEITKYTKDYRIVVMELISEIYDELVKTFPQYEPKLNSVEKSQIFNDYENINKFISDIRDLIQTINNNSYYDQLTSKKITLFKKIFNVTTIMEQMPKLEMITDDILATPQGKSIKSELKILTDAKVPSDEKLNSMQKAWKSTQSYIPINRNIAIFGSTALITLTILVSIYGKSNNIIVPDNLSTSTTPGIISNQTTISPNQPLPPGYIYQKDADTFMLLCLYCYYKDITGCFMVKGSDFYQITDDSCNDYYSKDVITQGNCSCGELDSALTNSPACDSKNECMKPYCIGNSQCSTIVQREGLPVDKCTTNPSSVLYKCTSSDFGSDSYVYYRYVDKTALALIADVAQAYVTMNKQPEQKSNTVLYIILIIVIGCLVALTVYFLNKKKI